MATPEGCVFTHAHLNSGMSKGGSGDTLAGIIAGLIPQKKTSPRLTFEQSIYLGQRLHSQAGDLARKKWGERSMSAVEVIASLSQILKKKQK